MDSSGSVGTSSWQEEVSFVNNMITSGVDEESHIGVVNFNSGAWTIWDIQDPQLPRSDITDAVDNIVYSGGATWMMEALNEAMSIFDNGDPNYDNLVILITDGNPFPSRTQTPCDLKQDLDNQGTKVVLIGIGDRWTESIIDCLVDDSSTQIIHVDDFSQQAFDDVRDLTDNFLCPATISLVLTEVRLNEAVINSNSSSKFVEFYVDSLTIPLATNPLVMNGIISGNITDKTVANITGGAYVVFYDSTQDLPKCYHCDNGCIDSDSNGLCDNAIYISCNGPSDECTFDSVTHSNDEWSITVQDGSDSSFIVNVAKTVANSDDWPNVIDGWTFELTDNTQNEELGENYAMSCFQFGTPGDATVLNCTGCDAEACTANGDDDATCSLDTGDGSTGECICTPPYYRAGSTCVLLENIVTCETRTLRDEPISDDYFQTVQIDWSSVEVTETSALSSNVYRVEYLDNNGFIASKTTSNPFLYSYNDESNAYTKDTVQPKVRIELETSDGETITSNWTECPISTLAPTKAPTNAPTFALPEIASCTASILAQSTNVFIDWTDADLDGTNHTASEVFGYYLFYSTFNSSSVTTIADISKETTSYTLDLGVDDLNNVPFDSKVLVASVSAIGYDSDNNVDLTRMQTEATNCELSSTAPSMAPSNEPSNIPTARPTDAPTSRPTMSPTYEEWSLINCVGTIERDLTSNNGKILSIEWQIGSYPGTEDNFNIYLRREIDNNPSNTEGDQFITSDSTITTAEVDTNGIISDFTIDDGFYIFPRANNKPNGVEEDQTGTYCSITTAKPTLTPSNVPSATPSRAPSGIPSVAPTGVPSEQPTPAPTYEMVMVSDCEFELFAKDSSFIVTFIEPSFDSNGVITPLIGNIRYLIEYMSGNGNEISVELQAVASDGLFSQQIDNTNNNGFDLSNGLTVTVLDNTDNNDVQPLGGAVVCIGSTQEPSPSPTTMAPTNAPTYESPVLTVDIGSIVGSAQCELNENSNYYECSFDESDSTPSLVPIIRTPEIFPYDISFTWEIDFDVNSGNRRRLDADESDFLGGVTEGTVIIEGSTEQLANIESVAIYLVQEDSSENTETVDTADGGSTEVTEGKERFVFRVTGCSLVDSGLVDIYPCSVGDTGDIIVTVNDKPEDPIKIEKQKGDVPLWVWYVAGGSALVVPVCLLFGWWIWRKKKVAEVMIEQKQRELDRAITLNDNSSFGGDEESVSSNPLATGGAMSIETPEEYIEKELSKQKERNETVTEIDFDPVVFKESVVAVAGRKPDHMMMDSEVDMAALAVASAGDAGGVGDGVSNGGDDGVDNGAGGNEVNQGNDEQSGGDEIRFENDLDI